MTDDNPKTAVNIAYDAGILRDFHFKDGTTERVADSIKTSVLMEGRVFSSRVYLPCKNPDEGGITKDFDQATFDKIWP